MNERFRDRTLLEHEISATTTTIATLQAELRELESQAADTPDHATPESRSKLLARLADCVRARDARFVAIATLERDVHRDP